MVNQYEPSWWDDPHAWRNFAACQALPPSWFFLERGDYHGAIRAKAICAQCHVRLCCLEDALLVTSSDDLTGIFGGVSASERVVIRRQRARQTVSVNA